MKILNIPAIGCLLVALTIPLASPVNAQILLKSSSDPMDKLTRCNNWWECYKEQWIEREKEAAKLTILPPPLPVATATDPLLPNLIPTDVDARFYGSSLQIKAQVDNIGDADAPGFDYRADVIFIRNDCWSLGAPTQFESVAHELWEQDWVAVTRAPFKTWEPLNV